MVNRGVLVLAGSIVAWAGCELFVSVPQGEVGSTTHCTADEQCPAVTPYCDLPTNACVECHTGADCTSDAPSCIAGACTSCRTDADCDGTTCLPDGTCADPSRVAFAAPAGTGDCSEASPCDLDTAVTHLSATVDIIQLLPGTYTRNTALTIATTAIIAGSSATLQGTTTPSVDVEGGNLTLLDVAIAANAQLGILCQSNGALTLRRVRVTGASTAVDAQGCALVMDRTSITGSSSYGIVVTTGPIAMSSSYVTGNGGGVALSGVSTGSIIDSTIASNTLIMGTFGVLCTTSATVVVENNIIWTNPTDPTCVASYCDLDAGYTGTGTNNVTMDPMFVGAPVDYHLATTSPLRGLGDAAMMDATDYDGEDRPQPAGSPPDLGADEIP
jgi:hypothetical protein